MSSKIMSSISFMNGGQFKIQKFFERPGLIYPNLGAAIILIRSVSRSIIEKTMEPLSFEHSAEDLLALIHWNSIDIVVGLAGTLLCICTLFVFLSSKKFFQANKLLTLLAVGDLSTCLGIITMGFIRKNMYMAAMETNLVPIESTWSCAIKPFVWLRLLGSLIAPGIVFWISVERFLAVFTPMIYRNHVANTEIPPLVIVIYTTVSIITAYIIAFANRNSQTAPFYCGRKVSFTVYYSSYVYCADVTGFMIALILNFLTLCKLANLYANRKNRFEVRGQLKRIRYMIVISLMSTLFVALPNGISLISAWKGRVNMYFVEPAVWLIAIKSSINIFVYLLLNTEFRQRVYELLSCLHIEDQKRKHVYNVSMFRSSKQHHNNVLRQMHGPNATRFQQRLCTLLENRYNKKCIVGNMESINRNYHHKAERNRHLNVQLAKDHNELP